MPNQTIRETARTVLKQLFDLQKSELGRAPTADEFFPVDLQKIVDLVIGWKVERVTGVVGFTKPGERVKGYCDFGKKTIRLDVQSSNEGQQNFTLAHEIGHAVLHKEAHGCTGGLALRTRSVRKNQVSADPESQRTEREAEVFASELLMPERAIRKHFQTLFGQPTIRFGSEAGKLYLPSRSKSSNDSTVGALARNLSSNSGEGTTPSLIDYFHVSASAMTVRLLELKLVY